MSMATSVEARVPFLDHHLVEFVAALPVSLKIRTLGTKQLLRHTMCDFLPPHTLARRKHAFLVPVDQWLRGPLRDFLRETLLTERARQRGWLDPTVVEAMVDAHRTGTASYGQQIWNLLCLELWARVFLDGRGREP
jgi:asparagine synthase (glutamine-hydrolysing)